LHRNDDRFVCQPVRRLWIKDITRLTSHYVTAGDKRQPGERIPLRASVPYESIAHLGNQLFKTLSFQGREGTGIPGELHIPLAVDRASALGALGGYAPLPVSDARALQGSHFLIG